MNEEIKKIRFEYASTLGIIYGIIIAGVCSIIATPLEIVLIGIFTFFIYTILYYLIPLRRYNKKRRRING